jgi:hypothetical protein
MATTNFTVAGKCRCSNNPVHFEYSKEPYEVHYCLEHVDADVRHRSLPLISPGPLQPDADNLRIME